MSVRSKLRRVEKRTLNALYRYLKIPFYNITASSVAGYTWFRVAKCGTRTTLEILRNETKPEIDGYNIPYFGYKHAKSFKFSFIRNPWDRLVSCYSNKVIGETIFSECWGRDFEYFVAYVGRQNLSTCNPHFRKQVALFPYYDLDFLGRFENFEKDLNYVMNDRLGLNVTIGHKNRSNHVHYTEYYNNRTQKLVTDMYKEDIEIGGYAFGG